MIFNQKQIPDYPDIGKKKVMMFRVLIKCKLKKGICNSKLKKLSTQHLPSFTFGLFIFSIFIYFGKKIRYIYLFILISFVKVAIPLLCNGEDCKIRLPETVNSYQPSIMPVPTVNGAYLFIDRKIHPDNTGGIRDIDDIWVSKQLVGDKWSLPENTGSPGNTVSSDVLFSITPDGSKALIYGLYNQGKKQPGFSTARLIKNRLTDIKPLKINDYYNDSSNFFGNLSADGRVLLLSLSRKDSYGNLDVYISFYDEKTDSYSQPLNLGSKINTSGIEGSPFLAWDNRTLYFSTNGRQGYGKLDLFMSRRLGDSWTNWTEPINLGSRINSKYDENSIHLTAMGDSAFITSADTSVKREGIYKICLPDSLQPLSYSLVSGRIILKDAGRLNTPKPDILFTVNYDNNYNVDRFHSYPGEDLYYFTVPPGTQANIIVSAEGYQDFSFSVFSKNTNKPAFVNYDIFLKRIKEKESQAFRIYFDYDSGKLTDSAITVLRELISSSIDVSSQKLLIISHTDTNGTHEYNLGLSDRRANSAAGFLKSLGFKAENFEIKSLGETSPVSEIDELNRCVEILMKNK